MKNQTTIFGILIILLFFAALFVFYNHNRYTMVDTGSTNYLVDTNTGKVWKVGYSKLDLLGGK